MARSLSSFLVVAIVAVSVLPLLAASPLDPEASVVRRAAPPGAEAPATDRAPLAAPARELRTFRPPPRLPRDERAPLPADLCSPSYLLPFLGQPARSSVP